MIHTLVAAIYLVCIYILLPVGLIAGWSRCRKWENKGSHVVGISALGGFSVATLSAAPAIASILYANFYPFRYYDPRLMIIYRSGFLLSSAGLILARAGMRKPRPVRWLAPLCAIGTLVFWVGAAAME